MDHHSGTSCSAQGMKGQGLRRARFGAGGQACWRKLCISSAQTAALQVGRRSEVEQVESSGLARSSPSTLTSLFITTRLVRPSWLPRRLSYRWSCLPSVSTRSSLPSSLSPRRRPPTRRSLPHQQSSHRVHHQAQQGVDSDSSSLTSRLLQVVHREAQESRSRSRVFAVLRRRRTGFGSAGAMGGSSCMKWEKVAHPQLGVR